jgi:hypothetical protein
MEEQGTMGKYGYVPPINYRKGVIKIDPRNFHAVVSEVVGTKLKNPGRSVKQGGNEMVDKTMAHEIMPEQQEYAQENINKEVEFSIVFPPDIDWQWAKLKLE